MRAPNRKLTAAWLLAHLDNPGSPEAMRTAVSWCYEMSLEEVDAMPMQDFLGAMGHIAEENNLEGKPD